MWRLESGQTRECERAKIAIPLLPVGLDLGIGKETLYFTDAVSTYLTTQHITLDCNSEFFILLASCFIHLSINLFLWGRLFSGNWLSFFTGYSNGSEWRLRWKWQPFITIDRSSCLPRQELFLAPTGALVSSNRSTYRYDTLRAAKKKW